MKADNYLHLLPNPISGGRQLTAQVNGDFKRGTLWVFDATGRTVHFQKLTAGAGEWQIETGDWQAGIYLVKILLDGEILTQELMVE